MIGHAVWVTLRFTCQLVLWFALCCVDVVLAAVDWLADRIDR